jgi:hypothetical protein
MSSEICGVTAPSCRIRIITKICRGNRDINETVIIKYAVRGKNIPMIFYGLSEKLKICGTAGDAAYSDYPGRFV